MRTSKTIYDQCNNSPRFWYFLYVMRYPRVFLNDFYIKIVGESSGIPDRKSTDLQVMEYIRPKFEQLFLFENELR